jgi:hypothetical protein
MRYALVFLIISLIASFATAQCPIELQDVSLDSKRGNLTINYYNSSTRVARDMHFILLSEDSSASSQPLVHSFSIRGTLRPKEKKTASFPVSGMSLDGTLVLKLKQVAFADGFSWFAHASDNCNVSFTEH